MTHLQLKRRMLDLKYGKAKSLGPETPRKAQIGEGALPVRHSLMHPIDFSPAWATSDPRAPRGRATTGGCIFVHDYNTLSALLTKRIARTRSLPGDAPRAIHDRSAIALSPRSVDSLQFCHDRDKKFTFLGLDLSGVCKD